MRLRHWWSMVLALVCAGAVAVAAEPAAPAPVAVKEDVPAIPTDLNAYGPGLAIAQLMPPGARFRNYANALPSLLKEITRVSTIRVDTEPAIIASFEDEQMFHYPMIYVNFADRSDWKFSPLEVQNLKKYLERGGFIFVDAGINSEFLRKNVQFGQHHSFADWQATPELAEAFAQVFPGRTFRPLPRSHGLFTGFYKGLPDPSILHDDVREYVVNEKWPQGTYSAVGLEVNGRLAVLATPILAMGWGKDSVGNWSTNIMFRIRNSAPGLSERLATAGYRGERFEASREDGRKDVIFCEQEAKPAWVQEPDGTHRVFDYRSGRENSDYAHEFYTRLGINIFVYALTH